MRGVQEWVNTIHAFQLNLTETFFTSTAEIIGTSLPAKDAKLHGTSLVCLASKVSLEEVSRDIYS
jgi:hypothetical protein